MAIDTCAMLRGRVAIIACSWKVIMRIDYCPIFCFCTLECWSRRRSLWQVYDSLAYLGGEGDDMIIGKFSD